MGQFYRTAKPDFVDNKMLELPYEMMFKAIQTKDKAVDDEIGTAVSLFDKLKANVYKTDAQRANQIINEKQSAIDNIVENIKKDPGSYMKYGSDIRQLSRGIQDTFLNPTGEISLMEKNNKDILEQMKTIKEKHKDEPAYAEAEIKALQDSYAKGLTYDPTSRAGKYNPNLIQTYELKHSLDDFIKTKLTADEWEKEQDSRTGTGYILRDKHSKEELTPDKIGIAYQSYFNAHQDIQDAVARRKTLGLQGFENADLSKAITLDDKGGIKSISDDWYGNNIHGAIDNMRFKKTKDSQTLQDDAQYGREWSFNHREDQIPTEHVGMTYDGVYEVEANSAKKFETSINATNYSLKSTYDSVIAAAGIKPDSPLGKQVLSGNSHAIETALSKAEPATANNLRNTYSSLRTQKNFLNAQAQGFSDFAARKGVKVNTQDMDWINKHQKLYNEFLTANDTKDKTKVTSNLVTLDKVGLSDKTVKELQGQLTQNFDDLVFNVDQTSKGRYMSFEKDNGDKVTYVPRGDRNAGRKVVHTEKGGKKWTEEIKAAPDGILSVQSLIHDGLIIPKKDDAGNMIYTTRENGKNVGVMFDEKTIGVDNSLDNAGKSNYGATMQIGNKRLNVLIPTDAIKIGSVDKYVQENYDDMQFNRFMSKTNLNTLGRVVADGPGGAKFMTEHGKAFVITSDGVKQEVTAPAQKREIYKICFAER